MPLDPGPDRISRYEIEGLIARGGMGRVYLARDPHTSRLVVVKLLDATLDSRDVRDRFDREAKSLASLSHPNIVHFYDYGDFQESPFIVMEYVRGETLEEKIKRRAPLPVWDKLRLMSEVCAGLAHAHASGIIHRDVKPANLMVDQDERLKILDFGIARVADSSLTRGYTQAGWSQLKIGTPGYMSPEQTRGDEIDRRTDIFSVGAVCYELFAYREAFPGTTADEIESKVIRTPPEPLTRHVPDLDPEIDEIVARALASEPKDRYQDATALADAFDRCRLRLAPPKRATSPSRATPPAGLVGRPAASRADAAYGRAVAAYEERAFDVAKRLLIEVLAEDPAHAGACALQGRLVPPSPVPVARPARPMIQKQPMRPTNPAKPGSRSDGPETISVDPTVLIDRASLPPPQQVDPTVVIRRDELPRRGSDPTAARASTPSSRPSRPVSDPTVLIERKQRAPSSTRPSARAGTLAAFWSRIKALGGGAASPARRPANAPASRRPGGLWTPATRGALIAVAAIVVAFLLVLGAMQMGGWLWPAGQLLTVTKPVGGTISGAGIRCGTRGSDCSTTRPVGDAVELQGEADAGYVLSGFTGDCPPTGRISMSQPRTCGATFDKVATATEVVWPLTITKPTGGTVVGPDIMCGTLGSACTANLPDGVPVTLHFETDTGYRFLGFTEDCDKTGNTTMSTARTCGANFFATPNAQADVIRPGRPDDTASPKRPAPVVQVQPPVTTPVPQGPSTPGTDGGTTTTTAAPTGASGSTAALPISPEAHSKREIEQLIKNYCASYETLKPERVKDWFPLVNERVLRDQFRQYKSLRCSVTVPTEYAQFDAGSAGAAQFKFEMKQNIETKVEGPKVQETIVTMKVSRTEVRSPWLIDWARHEPKPKP